MFGKATYWFSLFEKEHVDPSNPIDQDMGIINLNACKANLLVMYVCVLTFMYGCALIILPPSENTCHRNE